MSVIQKIRNRNAEKRTYFKSTDPDAIAAYVTYDVSEIPTEGKFKVSFADELGEHGKTDITVVIYQQ